MLKVLKFIDYNIGLMNIIELRGTKKVSFIILPHSLIFTLRIEVVENFLLLFLSSYGTIVNRKE